MAECDRRPTLLAIFELGQCVLAIGLLHSTTVRLAAQNAVFPYCGKIGWETAPVPRSLAWWYGTMGTIAVLHLAIGLSAWARSTWPRWATIAICLVQVLLGVGMAWQSMQCCSFWGPADLDHHLRFAGPPGK